jgi:hypothetical protein
MARLINIITPDSVTRTKRHESDPNRKVTKKLKLKARSNQELSVEQ